MLITFGKHVVYLFNEMAIYLLLGFTVAGILRTLFKDHFIRKHLGGRNFTSILLASFFGVPLPLCSCGVVPAAVSLKKQGASKGAVLAFLTSTPQTGIDSLLVTYSFLGLPFTLFKLVSSFITGIFAGILGNSFDSQNTITTDQSIDSQSILPPIQSWSDFIQYSFVELVESIRKWLFVGIIFAAALMTFLPDQIFSQLELTNHPIINYLIVLSISLPLYICSTASVPLAAVLVSKGFSLGSAIILLMAGPATNIATITVLWKTIGRKQTLLYLLNIIIMSFIFAYIFDTWDILQLNSLQHIHNHESFSLIKLIGSIVLLMLIVYSYIGKWITPSKKHKACGCSHSCNND